VSDLSSTRSGCSYEAESRNRRRLVLEGALAPALVEQLA
jgi:hypothetical protein